ncbi:MAG: nodulation protein NfeD [Nitrososphaerota archaeon]|nr:nodulation protein NfeD [Nitrososphaerota archaeon]
MKKKYAVAFFILLLLITVMSFTPIEGKRQSRVVWIKINGYISPATTEYINIVLSTTSEDYEIILITLDTLGGDATSTLEIIKSIQGSSKPVLCLVYPEGANAMSAGTYILMACKVSGMAPYTLIGACQPVVGGVPSNDTKLINFLSEEIATLARMNNRNDTIARYFVTKNLVLSADEALNKGVIEVIARDPKEFLELVDGREVTVSGRPIKLNTTNSILVEADKPLKIFFMEFLVDPLISSILLAVGIMTLILGFTSPGWGAEVAGGILILMGLVGQGFNVNLVGLLLVSIGAALLIYEVFTHTFGAIAIGGILSLSLGIILMAGSPPRPQYISQIWFNEMIWSISLAMLVISIFFGFLIYKAIRAVRSKPYLRDIPSEYGRAVDDLVDGKEGYVRIGGELWKATSRVDVKTGGRIKVVGRAGDVLIVEPVKEKVEDQY